MVELTFGEQVKIILSRKGMTIKELAEVIEERTGKKMSRQNLTQRLGRDNFQEQDMRMIAEILGCPFQLSILGDRKEELQTEADDGSREKPAAKKERPVKKETVKAPSSVERDITIGELMDIHEELDVLTEEKLLEKLSEEEGYAEETEHPELSGEGMQEAPVSGDPVDEDMDTAADDAEQEKQMEDEDRKHRGFMTFLQRKIKKQNQQPEEDVQEDPVSLTDAGTAPEEPDEEEAVQEEPVQAETVIREEEAQEEPAKDTEHMEFEEMYTQEMGVSGDINPYTGLEYESNSVRMHPKRIGYVQVYDREQHAWTDMTEWAFLGYQERKKALLGKDYEPPVYLD